MKIRNLRWKLIVTAVVLMYTVMLYISPVSCVFLTITGIPCPGCGMTRAILSVLQLRFVEAFSYHAMFWSLPFLYLGFLLDGKIIRQKWLNTLFWTLIGAGFVANWINSIYFS